MFFRCKTSPSGHCLQLLESYRNAQGEPRHRVVVSLGAAFLAEADQPLVAQLVEQRLRGQAELPCVSDQAGALAWADAIAKRVEREGRWRPAPVLAGPGPTAGQGLVLEGVLADQISHTHTTPLGPSLVAWHAWQRLRLDPAAGLTIYNSSSGPYTLKVMTVVALVFVPVIIVYQVLVYRFFRTRLNRADVSEGAEGY